MSERRLIINTINQLWKQVINVLDYQIINSRYIVSEEELRIGEMLDKAHDVLVEHNYPNTWI